MLVTYYSSLDDGLKLELVGLRSIVYNANMIIEESIMPGQSDGFEEVLPPQNYSHTPNPR
jgi:hypothetical protein